MMIFTFGRCYNCTTIKKEQNKKATLSDGCCHKEVIIMSDNHEHITRIDPNKVQQRSKHIELPNKATKPTPPKKSE